MTRTTKDPRRNKGWKVEFRDMVFPDMAARGRRALARMAGRLRRDHRRYVRTLNDFRRFS